MTKKNSKSKSQKSKVRILAIETSCDETSASLCEVKLKVKSEKLKVIENIKILSNVVSSQVKLHTKYGGVYPELASREHLRNIIPVMIKAISSKEVSNKAIKKNTLMLNSSEQGERLLLNTIDCLAITTGPGLIGSLLVGVETAKTLAYLFDKPIIPVNHLEGHIYSNFVRVKSKVKSQKSNLPKFPILALIVSGGHTSLVLMKKHLHYKVIGETLDDAAGEAFDKVAKLLGLSYPGGPSISKLAQEAKFKSQKSKVKITVQNVKICFPRPMIKENNFNFSFSGLKTAVLYTIKKLTQPLTRELKIVICKEFQEAVVETLLAKTLRAAKKYKVKSVLLCGGVASNSCLRKNLKLKVKNEKLKVNLFIPPKELCTDNAGMTGVAAAYKLLYSKPDKWYDINADANQRLANSNF